MSRADPASNKSASNNPAVLDTLSPLTTVPPSRSFVARVRAQMKDLPATERRLAEFVLDFPGDLASYNGSELAALAQVSKATVSRFVRRLGYPGYEEARRHVRDDKGVGAALLLAAADTTGLAQGIGAHAEQGQQNLAATFSRLSDDMIDDVARNVISARRVLVFGYRSSQSFANYFRWQIVQVIEHAIALPGAGETIGEYLADLDSKDCVVVFGLRRRVPQTEAILKFVGATGAKALYITDSHAAELAGAAWTIHCDVSAPGPLDNHVAVMAVCDLLATKILELSGNAGRKRLSSVESAHDALDEM